MRRYSEDDEQRVALQEAVSDWTRSGLLTPAQGAQLDAELRTTLRRTGLMLRLGLALFTLIAVGALVALTFVILDLRNDAAIGFVTGFFGLACFIAADALVARFWLYRHGVEEALAIASVILAGVAVAILTSELIGNRPPWAEETLGLAAAAAVSALVYTRFGFQYASIASMVLAACVPLQVNALNDPAQRMLAAAVCAATFVIARVVAKPARGEVRAGDAASLQAAAFLGVYLAINVHADLHMLGLLRGQAAPWFNWVAWALSWLLPVLGTWLGIRERNQWLLRATGAAALVTLLTNKLFLGWPRQTWDPMLLGLLLVAVAISVRRWLSSGPGGERNGYTAARLLESDRQTIRMVSFPSVVAQSSSHQPIESEPSPFDGGRSGGGGGGAGF